MASEERPRARKSLRVIAVLFGLLVIGVGCFIFWPRPATITELQESGIAAFGRKREWPKSIPTVIRSRLPDRPKEPFRVRVQYPLTPFVRMPVEYYGLLLSSRTNPLSEAELNRLNSFEPLPPPEMTKEEALRRLPAFEKIELLFFEGDAAALTSLLDGQTRLRELAIRDSVEGDAAVFGLASPTVERLEVFRGGPRGINGELIDRLGTLPRLNHLGVVGWLSADRKGRVPDRSDEVLRERMPDALADAGGDPDALRAELSRPVSADFSRFPNLRSAVLSALPLDGPSIESLAGCPNLVSLQLADLPNVPAASLAQLIERTNLHRLKIMSGVQVDDAVRRAAADHPKLRLLGQGWRTETSTYGVEK